MVFCACDFCSFKIKVVVGGPCSFIEIILATLKFSCCFRGVSGKNSYPASSKHSFEPYHLPARNRYSLGEQVPLLFFSTRKPAEVEAQVDEKHPSLARSATSPFFCAVLYSF